MTRGHVRSKESAHFVDFYHDIDNLKIKSSCSLSSVLVLLILIFLLGLASLIFLASIRGNYLMPLRSIEGKQEQESNLLTGTNINSGQEEIVRISQSDLAKALGVQNEDFPLRKADLLINSSYIVLTGNIKNSILSPRLSVYLVPEVRDSEVQVKIAKIEIAQFAIPSRTSEMINQNLADYLAAKKIISNNIRVEKILLAEGYLDVFLIR